MDSFETIVVTLCNKYSLPAPNPGELEWRDKVTTLLLFLDHQIP